ncbi:hypothetical protein [Sorangium sp. So ce1024]|uniref:hypothetical protein n=1 Tax=Sorangium sp. So ce1024 TaxID=3133327 RepID=UPI003F117B85
MSHLITARRCIAGAINNPDAAAELLSLAVRHIRAALALVTPATPADLAQAVTAEAERLFAVMQGFEEA